MILLRRIVNFILGGGRFTKKRNWLAVFGERRHSWNVSAGWMPMRSRMTDDFLFKSGGMTNGSGNGNGK